MECDIDPKRPGGYEVGPIRPPSEAGSLLVRVTRSCPWNRCAFCPVYKGDKGYSRRSVEDVHADLDALHQLHGDHPTTVFLQDADPMLAPPDVLVAIVERVRERFPRVRRITTYARAKTLARRSVEDLTRIREAGLDRVHVGLESGSDAVLELVNKGATRAEQIEGGQRAKAAGFELSEYVMPGLGGRELSDEHADDTASAVAAIEPDFVRLRTLAVVPGTPLGDLQESGAFTPLGEIETLAETRRFLSGLEGVATRLESDHALNLLLELRGSLPGDHDRLLGMCDELLALPAEDQVLLVLGRRLGMRVRPRDLDRGKVRTDLQNLMAECLPEGTDPEVLFRQLRLRFL